MPDYVPTDWVDNVTPVDEARMDKMEAGIDGAVQMDSELAAAVRLVANKLLAGDTQAAFRILGDGKLEWGPGGSSARDTFLARLSTGVLGLTGKFSPSSFKSQAKAGVPVDGDVSGGAANGDMILDTTNSRLYFRIGGVWHYCAINDGAGGAAVDYKGAWSSVTAYAQGDVVLYQGREYIAVNPGTNQTPPTPALLGPTVISLVTVLPTSPFDGQEVDFTDSLTTPTFVWRLRYVAAKGSNKWVFIGGAPIMVAVETAESTSSTTYVALTTAGPSITLPVAGIYQVEVGHMSAAWTAAVTSMSFDIGGTAAVDLNAAITASIPSPGGQNEARRVTQIAAGAVALVSKYKVSTGGPIALSRRYMRVTPVAVG